MIEDFFIYKLTTSNIRSKRLATGEIVNLTGIIPMNLYDLYTVRYDIKKGWIYNRHKYFSGVILDYKFDESNIKTKGLEYESAGIWDPYKTHGVEAEKDCSDYIQEGYRESYVFNDYTARGFYKHDEDPVNEAVEANEFGNHSRAYDILAKLLEDYPECIDALVHIGNIYIDSKMLLKRSCHCYKTAVYIAEKNFQEKFDPVFLWSQVNNRPYLRALYGLCLANWRMKNFSEAHAVAKKLLRLNPPDNLGIRGILDKLKNHTEWHDDI